MFMNHWPKLVACSMVDRLPLRATKPNVVLPSVMHAVLPADPVRPKTIIVGDVHGVTIARVHL